MTSTGIIILLMVGVVSVLASPSGILHGLGGQGEMVGPHVGHSHCGFSGEQKESHGRFSGHGHDHKQDHEHEHNHGGQNGGSQGGFGGQGGSHDEFREHNHGYGGHDNHY